MSFNDLIKLDFRNLGFQDNDIVRYENEAISARNLLKKKRESGELGFYDIVHKDKTELIKLVSELKKKFKRLIVFGIGGSALGTRSIIRALKDSVDFDVFVFDNIDSDEFKNALNFDPNETLYNVVSKSGTTAESICQFLITYNYLKERVKDISQHFVFTTSENKGDLAAISKELGILKLIVPDNVGGRYSVFSDVGLFPIAMAGIDIRRILEGTKIADSYISNADGLENAFIKHAAVIYKLEKELKKSITVFMTYSDLLSLFNDWLVQLWAESLGKRFNMSHKEVFEGSMPISAVGARDQHSVVQLFKEGPNDKYFTFINISKRENELKIAPIPELSKYSSIKYLLGQSMARLINAEFNGTRMALTKNSRLNMTITLKDLSPEVIGALYYYFECLIPLVGTMYKINPFDQPGVEEGKQYAYALMGREGYENLKL